MVLLSCNTKRLTNEPPSEAKVKLREAAFTRIEDATGMSDPKILPSTYSRYDQRDTYLHGLEWGKLLLDDGSKYQHAIFANANHHFELINCSPYGLHSLMFVPTLELQCSDAQKQYWLPLAKSGKIIGAYCQTELGHGTFLRGLETTATLDMQTDEWVVDSPTVTSTKFWPGGIGYSATHAIVMAKAVIKGQDYGTHPFIMQLRSLDDHKALPGIELGDIGLKFGYNETDNGFARFDHVRIPREYLLMGNVEVKRDGSYIKPQHQKLFYASMTFTRMNIAFLVAFQLAQAVTIAIRYSVVREQGFGQEEADNTQEHAIISYKCQARKTFRPDGASFCNSFRVQVLYDCVRRDRRSSEPWRPDTASLQPRHHGRPKGLCDANRSRRGRRRTTMLWRSWIFFAIGSPVHCFSIACCGHFGRRELRHVPADRAVLVQTRC